MDPRRVADVERAGAGGADGVRVDVLRHVPVLEHEVLEEGVGGQRRGQERRREEAGRVRHHRGRGAREHGAVLDLERRARAVAAVVRHGGKPGGDGLGREIARERGGWPSFLESSATTASRLQLLLYWYTVRVMMVGPGWALYGPACHRHYFKQIDRFQNLGNGS